MALHSDGSSLFFHNEKPGAPSARRSFGSSASSGAWPEQTLYRSPMSHCTEPLACDVKLFHLSKLKARGGGNMGGHPARQGRPLP